MSDVKIKNLDSLVSKQIAQDEKIVGYDTARLTALGDNYGSLMLSLKIKLKNDKNREEKVLETIAKLIPRTEFVQKIFNVQVTFRNEIEFYSKIVPTLNTFLEQKGFDDRIDFVAKYFGGRLNLANENVNKVDEDAVLILENLKVQGFTIANRMEGFDLHTAQLIISLLAKFHTTALALKFKNLDVFEENVKPYLHDFQHGDIMHDVLKELVPKTLLEDPQTAKYADVARNKVKLVDKSINNDKWATIIHNDLWVNNVMIKQQNGRTTDLKFVDFQTCEYKSALRDLIFFLFSSISVELLEKHLDELIDLYYGHFINNFKRFQVDISDFSRQEFDKQLEYDATEGEFYRLMVMLNPIYVEKPFDLNELNDEKNIGGNVKDIPPVGEKHKEKLKYIVKKYFEKGWFQL